MISYFVLAACCLALVFLCALLSLAIRQLGVLNRRLELVEADGVVKPNRLIGKNSPLTRFQLLDGKYVQLPLYPSGKTYLIFISFTCALCRPVLHRLFEMQSAIKTRTVLMYLQDGVNSRFKDEIERLGLTSFLQMEALDYVEHFETDGAPYLIVMSAANVIIEARPTSNWDELIDLISEHEREEIKLDLTNSQISDEINGQKEKAYANA